jgi:hypothetical protein
VMRTRAMRVVAAEDGPTQPAARPTLRPIGK